MPGTSRPDLRALGPVALGSQDHKDVRLSLDVIGTVRLNDWDERLDTVTRGLLGVSVARARCHDHKFDTREGGDSKQFQNRLTTLRRNDGLPRL